MESLYIGTKFFGHDSSVFCILPEDREIVAISTERTTRFKHDDLYPIPAIYRLVDYIGCDPSKVKEVHFANAFVCQQSEKRPVSMFETNSAFRLLYNTPFKADFDRAHHAFHKLPGEVRYSAFSTTNVGKYLYQQEMQTRESGGEFLEELDHAMRRYLQLIFPNARIVVRHLDHQICHIYSAIFSSPFENQNETLFLSMDGCGDDSYSKAYMLKGHNLVPVADCIHHYLKLDGKDLKWTEMGSPGGIYHYFTYLLGFQPDADEGKVEALAAFADPDPTLLKELLSIFVLDQATNSLVLQKELAEKLLNYDRIQQDVMPTLKREVIAATVQTFLEIVMLDYTKLLVQVTGAKNICLCGGVAANVIMNLQLFEQITPNLHIVPAMGDDGSAQGAAIWQSLMLGASMEQLSWLRERRLPYYGTSYSAEEVGQRLEAFSHKISFENLGPNWPEMAAKLLVDGEIGAIFHGRMEWGPRALGNRSIIADARRADMRELINREIKRRPLFQPFCPSILLEEKERLFSSAYANKHMTCAFRMKPEHIPALPSAVHTDGTARVQFVEESDNPNYYKLIKKFKELTGYGVIINTSFNRHGRTIVESPEDAIHDFLDTDLGFLVIEGWLVRRLKAK